MEPEAAMCVVGNSVQDIVLVDCVAPALPGEITVEQTRKVIPRASPGGKGFVVASALAIQGAKLSFPSLIDRTGEATTGWPERLSTSDLVRQLADVSRAWLVVDDSGHVTTYFYEPQVLDLPAAIAAVCRAVRTAAHVHVTYERSEIIRAVVSELGSLRRLNGPGSVSLSVDLSSALVTRLLTEAPNTLDALIDSAQYVFGNTQEIIFAESSGLEIRRRPGLEVIETQGSRGGMLYENLTDEPPRRTAFSAYAPDQLESVVGAGDTFAAGYLFARVARLASPASAWAHASHLTAVKIASPRSALLDADQDQVDAAVGKLTFTPTAENQPLTKGF